MIGTEFNATNPTFFSFLELLSALIKAGFLQTLPDDKSSILVYKTDLPPAITHGTPLEGKKEGWVAENIFSVAQSLFNDKDERAEFYKTLKEKGIIPTFNENGTFRCLNQRKSPHTTLRKQGREIFVQTLTE